MFVKPKATLSGEDETETEHKYQPFPKGVIEAVPPLVLLLILPFCKSNHTDGSEVIASRKKKRAVPNFAKKLTVEAVPKKALAA